MPGRTDNYDVLKCALFFYLTREFEEMGKCFHELKEECNEMFLLENKKRIYHNTSVVTEYVCSDAAKGEIINQLFIYLSI